ncbi:signal peptidase I [Rathayibacter rathayi]|uniref:Signal peptidase I n=1 Tax=Rathayibacter rathayi TaxID=33887 RepID=A0ABX5AGY3_RATRA|nr:signal peptidase I [Rathayibacter rathayi]PPF24279.1 signal peptidase I [Rathayibacter rathayi]PPF51600.1 signal peptidase I [Rathayibacter rathayi]PPF83191.1 signal peptidase I [Rathayibacter rathayi]PPG14432.1 signal peptidase I [Rathayibacter rathayi]PPG47021.1 signal peptidase I [Rathayibacter rathayi]
MTHSKTFPLAPLTPELRRPRDAQARRLRRHRRTRRRITSYASFIAIVTVLALPIGQFAVRTVFIPSESMADTLAVGDLVIVNRLPSYATELKRGDIVVFSDRNDWLGTADGGETHLVKRVIGLPGDHVSYTVGGEHLLVNGEPIDEAYIAGGSLPSRTAFDVVVPEGSLWVLGDNRDNSADSRAYVDGPGSGFVPMSDVLGTAVAMVWPVPRFGLLHDYRDAFADVPDAR